MSSRREAIRRLTTGAKGVAVSAIQAGKDVYQEKTMAFSPDHARRMRKAFAGSGRMVQAGMQMNTSPALATLKEPNCPFEMGYRTAIACQMAVASYRRQRAVRWDPKAEQIV